MKSPRLSTPVLQIFTKDAEQRLMERVNELRMTHEPFQGVLFGFSKLLEHYRTDSQIRIATNLIRDLLDGYDGTVYVCEDATICAICHDVPEDHMNKVIFQLRYLFADDPLAYHQDGAENEEFCKLYWLNREKEWEAFHDEGRRRLSRVNRFMKAEPAEDEPRPQVLMKGQLKRFTPADLVYIEKDLAKADISHTLRRQPICAVPPGGTPRRVFDEIYINIAHLRQLLKVPVDLHSDRALFKYLTQILDHKVLELLRRTPTRYFTIPLSINLNVGTVLSDQFADFDANIKDEIKISVVIEIHISDAFADLAAYHAAREVLQKLGYRVCLDGLDAVSFAQINRERLKFDLAKLQWNADQTTALGTEENRALAEAIQRCGTNRMILCRCDTIDAIDYGRALGMSLFQGRYLDALVNPTAKLEN